MFSTLLHPVLFTISLITTAFSPADQPQLHRGRPALDTTPPALVSVADATTSTGTTTPQQPLPTAAPEAGTSHDPFGKD
jgi:hypothetical protein